MPYRRLANGAGAPFAHLGGCAGAIRGLDHAVAEAFEVALVG
jgi:hypothetical protein